MGIFDRKGTPPQTFAEALMGDLVLDPSWVQEKLAASGAESSAGPSELSERALVLESFTQFANEKLAAEGSEPFQFPGGEVARKEDPAALPLRPIHGSRAEWAAAAEARVGAQTWQDMTQHKSRRPLVLFVSEAIGELPPEAPGQVLPEFLHCFAPAVAEYFQRMVQAMKLAPQEYVLTGLRDARGEKNAQELFEEAWWWEARFVVPLGAQACAPFLGSRERLANIHGRFYSLPRLRAEAQVVPLFHPGVISTNMNMKKSTWVDMQKIMKALGKAP